MSTTYVLPYVNPDADGVCSAIAYASYLKEVRGINAIPGVVGDLDAETNHILRKYHHQQPITLSRFALSDEYIVVDTHQVNQLPPDLPVDRVVEILDHHPVGDAEHFPNASIANEKVGAVATIVAERYRSARIIPDRDICCILYMALVSNTLNFSAPTTDNRDLIIAEWLNNVANVTVKDVEEMFVVRSDLGQKTTYQVLVSDFKEFDFSGVRFGMAQLETLHLDEFLQRRDILDALKRIQLGKDLLHILFVGADMRNHVGVVISPDATTRQIVEKAVSDAKFVGETAKFSRILLRKSDLIPPLKSYFAAECSNG